VLLRVPHYDFNWQSSYRLAKPLHLPAGSRIECTAHFDNSEDNPNNPDPKKTVRWGEQTWEEMMIGFVDYVFTAKAKE
ncbi:MAG: alkyl hydroperoxide reductase, partial [Gemmataceae bacterium]